VRGEQRLRSDPVVAAAGAEFAESFRGKHPEPLGEEEIERVLAQRSP
jgi:hypothetical protein